MWRTFIIILSFSGCYATVSSDYINIILTLKISQYSDCLLFITPEYDLSSLHWIKIIIKTTTGVLLPDISLNRQLNFCFRPFYIFFPIIPFYPENLIPKIFSIPKYDYQMILIPGSRSSLDPFLKEYYLPINWLFFIADQTKSEEKLWYIHEVYKKSRTSHLHWNIYAIWRTNKLDVISHYSLAERRKDLGNIVFRTVTNNAPPLTSIAFGPNGDIIYFGGFFGELFHILKEKNNFRATYTTDLRNSFGVLLPNGTWTGIFGIFQRGEGDFMGAAATMTSIRSTIVKYLPVVSKLTQDMFIREPNEEINWTGFFRPFETPLWITFLGISIMFGIISKVLLILTDQNSSLEESIFLSFSGIFFQQASSFTGNTASSRILLFTIYALGLIGFSAYSGKLIAFLTYKTLQMPFDSPEGLLADGSYLVGTISGSATFTNLQKAKGGVLKALFQAGIAKDPSNALPTVPLVFERACTHRYSVIGYRIMIDMRTLSCTLVRLKKPLLLNPWTLSIPLHSEYLFLFQYMILKLKENGVVRLVMERTMPIMISPARGGVRAAHAASQAAGVKSAFDPISFTNIISIFLIYLIGLFLSIIVFISELIYSRFKSRKLFNLNNF